MRNQKDMEKREGKWQNRDDLRERGDGEEIENAKDRRQRRTRHVKREKLGKTKKGRDDARPWSYVL